MKEKLNPSLEDLGLECVLMQAWKKTSSYLRYHSWYADTLDIDYQSLRIPDFIREIQDELKEPEKWRPRPLKMVPAPKSQKWEFDGEGNWRPQEGANPRLRPLAHVALRDQVVATAIMMCLADRVETFLGDPRLPIKETKEDKKNRKEILAYGHRLFCDFKDSGGLHRWGSTKLYRQYFQDYRVFLERSDVVADLAAKRNPNSEIAVIHSDLSEFYDRVRPSLLNEKLRTFQRKNSLREKQFFDFAERVFNWQWSGSDRKTATSYGKQHEIEGVEHVALPQGLVASGFLANVVLSDFDSILSRKIGKFLDIEKQFLLEDACYYVDDIRLVVRISKVMSEDDIKSYLIDWLQKLLKADAPGLLINEKKTEVTVLGRKERFLVSQSKSAQRIQREVSGTLDMLSGTELIGAIESFFHTQKKCLTFSDVKQMDQTGLFMGVSDMTDETASRFAAGRFRRTFRSLRPLLTATEETKDGPKNDGYNEETADYDQEMSSAVLPHQLVLSQGQLDERARFFATLLIEEWIVNPANIRLIRVAFDMYPDEKLLDKVLKILRQGLQSVHLREERKVYLYCLAELFRAGATETAMVSAEDCLPDGISVKKYRERLLREAVSILDDYIKRPKPRTFHPWYLMQQIMLYLATQNAFPESVMTVSEPKKDLDRYFGFANFLGGRLPESFKERAILLVMARTGFGIADFERLLNKGKEAGKFLTEVARISPAVACQLWSEWRKKATDRLIQRAYSLGLEPRERNTTKHVTVADLANQTDNPFYQEQNLLELASWLIDLDSENFKNAITPWQIYCDWQPSGNDEDFGKVIPKYLKLDDASDTVARLFDAPGWCENSEERRKFQTGLLLRFAIRGTTAFDSSYLVLSRLKPLTYKRPFSHWEQQRHSSYQGRSAFGAPWLPLSSFVDDMLFQLLRWPGAGISTEAKSLDQIRKEIAKRIGFLRKKSSSAQLFLDQKAPLPPSVQERLLRVGIVQSVIPSEDDYKKHSGDPLLNDVLFRKLHKQHLSSLMRGVAHMLQVRNTHINEVTGLDLLVFPELSVHQDDLKSFIVPFVQQYKCAVLCGMVYHRKYELDPNSELLNSCLWVIPEWTSADGFQVCLIEQGKKHKARNEKKIEKLADFRPVQWLVQYEWDKNRDPLVLSASVCFDATDLALATDLRSKSDLYIVCALNKDVATFDRMSESLHYHMFQGVIVVNNGLYGGSSFFMPFDKSFRRRVFHLHGQPQATISFAEIDPEKLLKRPRSREDLVPEGKWKTPPAGWKKR